MVRSSGQGESEKLTLHRSLHVYQKPEPLRLSTEMLSRSVIECPIAEGDPTSLVSALGYARLFTLIERGHRFHRGAVIASVYQLYEVPSFPLPRSSQLTSSQSATSTTPLDPTSWIVNLSTKCPRVASTTGASTPQAGPSAQEVKIQATERMREVAGLLRGVVDLARVE